MVLTPGVYQFQHYATHVHVARTVENEPTCLKIFVWYLETLPSLYWCRSSIWMRALMFLAVFASLRIVLAILDVIPMSSWKWKFTLFLALFSCAS